MNYYEKKMRWMGWMEGQTLKNNDMKSLCLNNAIDSIAHP